MLGELEEAELSGADPQALEAMRSGLENMAEAFVGLREARAAAAAHKRRRGYGAPGAAQLVGAQLIGAQLIGANS